MQYTNTLYVVATKNQACGMFPELGEARRAACEMASNDPGRTYGVYEWRNGEDWHNRPTRHEYRGFVIITPDAKAEKRRADAIKAAADLEWGRHDSERGHANMQTAHNQLAHWK